VLSNLIVQTQYTY